MGKNVNKEIYPKDNKFILCHLGDLVCQLEKIYHNDMDFVKEIRNVVKQLTPKKEK